MPASQETITLYAAYLARRLKPPSVRQYLNIVRIMHLEAGLENPMKDSWYVASTLKGIDRVLGTPVNRKTPITPEILFKIKRRLEAAVTFDFVFWAACLLMFFGLFRKSNLFARGEFNPTRQFTRDCFVLNVDKSMSIVVRWSKTIQFKGRTLKVTLPTIHPHPLCPVSAMCKALQTTTGQAAHTPAFPITAAQFDKKLREVTMGDGNFSGHSFRRGGACWALSQNIPSEAIKLFGDWKSNAYLSYLDQIPPPVLYGYRKKFAYSLPLS